MTLRFPLVARVAARNALQRKGQTLLVVLGCLLGTAIITGSLVVGDMLDASIRARAPEQLGPVDVVVHSFATTIAEGVDTITAVDPPPSADGLLPVRTADATMATIGGTERAVVPRTQVLEIDFGAAAGFGGDPSATGIAGSTPRPGHVALGEDLAQELDVAPGDAVDLFVFGQNRALVVDRVLPRLGIAGYAGPFDATPRNAFVAPGLLVELSTLSTVEAPLPDRMLFLSAIGDVFTGAERTDELVAELRERFSYLVGYEIEAVKQNLFTNAAEAGASLRELFVSVAAFAVLAGVILLVNVLVMLAEERRRELGVLRALGLRRRGLVAAIALEGALYALASAAAGAVAGLGVGWAVARLAGGLFSSAQSGGVSLRFAFEFSTLAVGFAAGFTVSLVTVVVTSTRLSRLSVGEAMRGRAPLRRGGSPRVVVLGAGGALLSGAASVWAWRSGDIVGGLAYPCLTVTCLAFAVAHLAGAPSPAAHGRARFRRLVLDAAAAAVLVWTLAALAVFQPGEGDVGFFVGQGLLLTLTAVVLLSSHQGSIAAAVHLLGGTRLVALRLAFAYPLAHRLRTALVLLSYSLVVFTVVFASVQSAVFLTAKDQLVLDEGGGFDVLATNNPAQPIDPAALAGLDGVEAVSSHLWTVAEFRVGDAGAYDQWALSGFDAEFLRHGAPALEAFDPAVGADAEAVWEAVQADPTLAVADVAFLETGGGPPEGNVAVGDDLEIRDLDSGLVSRRKVAAISSAGAAFSGVFVSRESYADAVLKEDSGLAGPAELPVPSRHHLALEPGRDPDAVAAAVERTFLSDGVEARSFSVVVGEALQRQDEFFDLMEGYLVLGLLVGIAGLGVVMTRAVRERRREVGVLLGIGCPAATVRHAFLLESAAVALQAVLVGGGLALLTCWMLVTRTTAFGTAVEFAVPWAEMLGLLTVTVATSLLAALVPAIRAARLLPAAALRLAD